MNILEILYKELEIEIQDDNIKDGVFYPTLYRLGREDHKDCPREERSELLTYLEKIKC